MKLLNAFSLSMIGEGVLHVKNITACKAAALLSEHGMESCVGHDPTLIAAALGMSVPLQRVTVTLTENERAIIAQYIGPRLPPGATTLPPDAQLIFKLVEYHPSCTT